MPGSDIMEEQRGKFNSVRFDFYLEANGDANESYLPFAKE